ncbi:MAG: HAD family hydrolase [Kiritimatiellaeota bacterium]|nr:HAD family hydrolase [Kiritimatiellota bacterium]
MNTTLVGVDSDGCVFDTMGVKQRNYFAPLIVQYWRLEPIREAVVKRVDFLNLASIYRGQNRYPNLLRLFEMIHAMPEAERRGITPPPMEALRAYCASGLPLGHPSLKAEVERTKDPELAHIFEWSLAVNRDIHDKMPPVPPFRWALKSLELMAQSSDIVVISQTPAEALHKEWGLHDVERFVQYIAGQEQGSKTEQLQKANGGRYPVGKAMMIGDAPGDAKAARETQSLFFPVLPGQEETSWQRFHDEAYPLFLAGRYTDAYQSDRLAEFNACLPERFEA